MPGIGARRRVAGRQFLRQQAVADRPAPASIADAEEPAVPAARRQPEFDADVRVGRRLQRRLDAAEGRERRERVRCPRGPPATRTAPRRRRSPSGLARSATRAAPALRTPSVRERPAASAPRQARRRAPPRPPRSRWPPPGPRAGGGSSHHPASRLASTDSATQIAASHRHQHARFAPCPSLKNNQRNTG